MRAPGQQSRHPPRSVNGVARTHRNQIFNDDPPNQAVLDVTFSGLLPIAAGDTVTFSTRSRWATPGRNCGPRA
jgi:hypothetical protein